jgi:ribonuclease H2 subunit C
VGLLTGVEVEGVKVEEAFFRGRKLQGATLTLPDGYRGDISFLLLLSSSLQDL